MGKFITFWMALVLSQFLYGQASKDSVYTHVDVMPYFPGCDMLEYGSEARRKCSENELVKFISRQLVFPEEARNNNVEGTVYVSFIVDETGAVQNPSLLKDIGGGCGEAALQVLQKMPDWEPGMHHNQRVKVKLNLPIHFNLKNAAEEPGYFTITWGNLRGEAVTEKELAKSLDQTVYVRDTDGNLRYIDQLAFTYIKNRKKINATSRGAINADLSRVVERSRQGGTFTITASIQDKGKFVYVSRSFLVRK